MPDGTVRTTDRLPKGQRIVWLATMRSFFLCAAYALSLFCGAQTLVPDTLTPAIVESVRPDIARLPAVQDTWIMSGRKTEAIDVDARDAALTEKYARQIFAKVPGIFVYDMDGTGNQLNIAARGLDPHRSWEFNIRKDGVLTNTDMYGYPASHYNAPMEAVARIELVRGTGSLQYGAQFGGLLNLVTKGPDTARAFAFESVNTVGSFGLLGTFNRASGLIGKWTYNIWMQRKGSDGYRDNARSDSQAQNITIGFAPSRALDLVLEWTRSDYVVQLPGPLNDSMFRADPRASTRSRNYYEPDIHVPSFTVKWRPSARTQLRWTTSAVLGARYSTLFDRPATIADAIDSTTLRYAARQVDIDNFHSFTSELRVRHDWTLNGRTSTWAAGAQLMRNDLNRRQMGKGTTGSEYDLTLTVPSWRRDLHYRTENIAFFAESRWSMTDRLAVVTGARLELGSTELGGRTTYYPGDELPTTIAHRFPLFGASAEYRFNGTTNAYAGWSQAYRPVVLKDIIPASVFESTDKDLKDVTGHNAEAGVRGTWKALRWDVSVFQLVQRDRLGTLASEDSAGNVLVRRTNTGDSRARGVECFVQADIRIAPHTAVSLFTSTAWMDARYLDAMIRSGNGNTDISGNNLECAPEWTSRSGITLRYHNVRISALFSHVSETFADALNTREPNASGTVGLVPAYSLLDLNVTWMLNSRLEFRANLNNALDERYFTKRPQFYPGPGIWPSDGRGWSVSVALRV